MSKLKKELDRCGPCVERVAEKAKTCRACGTPVQPGFTLCDPCWQREYGVDFCEPDNRPREREGGNDGSPQSSPR